MAENPLRIFVAMPGKDLGPNASFKSSDGVKESFLKPVRERLEKELGRSVIMKIEKDEDRPGSFGESMFKEAFEAEVYIADLTGANPNVYLELGVRWTAADNVTVLVIQDMKDYRPNIGQQKVIQYGGQMENLQEGINRTVNAIVNGLREKDHVDSLVRSTVPVVTCSRKDWEEMKQIIAQLREQRGEEFLTAAMSTDRLKQRIEFLSKAIEINPLLHSGYYELGHAYANAGDRQAALESYREAVRLAPGISQYHKDLGIMLSRWGERAADREKIELAIAELDKALGINTLDPDARASLGGALRRLAMWQAPRFVDVNNLRKAQECYDEAGRLTNGNDPYPLLNSARIEMLLAGLSDGDNRLSHMKAAKSAFVRILPLCQYKANQALEEGSQPWWPMLDQHDCLLFSGRIKEASDLLVQVKGMIPETDFCGVRDSFLSLYRELLSLNVLDGEMLDVAKTIVREWSSGGPAAVEKH